MGIVQPDRFKSSEYEAEVVFSGRKITLRVQEVMLHGGSGDTKAEVLVVTSNDGRPLSVFPRAANAVWVQ